MRRGRRRDGFAGDGLEFELDAVVNYADVHVFE